MRGSILGTMILLLAGCGPPSTNDWLGQLKDPDVVKRRQAIRELGTRTAEAERIVPAISETLRDDSAYVRRDAATVLGKFGPEAKAAVPALIVALRDQNPKVRLAAGKALVKIDPEVARAKRIR